MKFSRICLWVIVLSFVILPFSVFASPLPTITDAIAPIDQNAEYDTTVVRPGTVLRYPLTADMFEWTSPPDQEDAPMTLLQLRRSDVSVRHNSIRSRLLKDVTLSTMRFNDQTTACVKVEFTEEFISVDMEEFMLDIYLSVGNTRQDASEITLYGEFGNEKVDVGFGDDYVDLSDGQTLVVDEYIANLEIDMGDGVWIYSSVSAGREYYATAKNEMVNADAPMLEKFPAIKAVVRLTTNLIPSGKCVSMEEIGFFYVYDENGAYLGTTDQLVTFSELYYLADEKIDMGGIATTKPNAPDGAAAEDKPQSPFAIPPAEQAAKADMAAAAQAATASGSDTANVMAKDVEKVSPATLEAMYKAAMLAKTKAQYTVDTTTLSGQIQGRIEINPALGVNLKKDILLGVFTSDIEIDKAITNLNKTYSNRLNMIRLSHQGSYGMSVKIIAKLKLENVDMDTLSLYRIDKVKNRIVRFVPTECFLDVNGYLHFNTIYGGDIIVSQGLLAKKT